MNSLIFIMRIPLSVLIFIFFAQVSSCDSVGANNSNPISVQGVIFDVFLNDTLAIQPETLLVSGEEVPVSQSGIFELDLPPGVYPIHVQSQHHETLVDSITIESELEIIPVELKPILDDYFPLYIGQSWDYHYLTIEGGLSNNPLQTKTEGALHWEIIGDSVSAETGELFFLAESSFNGLRTTSHLYDENRADTSIVNSIERFAFVQNDTGNVFSSFTQPTAITIGPWNSLEYSASSKDYNGEYALRYLPRSRVNNENITFKLFAFGNRGIEYSFQREVGLVEYFCQNSGHTRFETTITYVGE